MANFYFIVKFIMEAIFYTILYGTFQGFPGVKSLSLWEEPAQINSVKGLQENSPYTGGQWGECPFHWRSVVRVPFTLAVSGASSPYVGSK